MCATSDAEAFERGWRAAIAYCRRPEHLRRTLRIALIVGIVLTTINQLDVILRGEATTATWIKCAMNFVVPFVVSNLGLLSGRH
ncbi:MAG: nitrate/nitrite transporter NrtS [Actinobacteria bacterium]|nr:nitrate/nitrite transporter NrtS [Actinomycetota bacterium]